MLQLENWVVGILLPTNTAATILEINGDFVTLAMAFIGIIDLKIAETFQKDVICVV